MADTFHLVVASVGHTKFDGPALSATIPTTNGEITILAHHEPLVATLREGTITVREAASSEGRSASGGKEFPIQNGVLEISANRAVVLL